MSKKHPAHRAAPLMSKKYPAHSSSRKPFTAATVVLVTLIAGVLVFPGEQKALAATLDAEVCTTGNNPTFNGGSGTLAEPFLISSAGNLETLARCVAASRGSSSDLAYPVNTSSVYYRQTTNIDGDDNKPIGVSITFKANYDGAGFAVHSFSQSSNQLQQGLFAQGQSCTVKNLTVSATISSTSNSADSAIGIVMGRSSGCTIDNVTAYGVVNVYSVGRAGGVVGYASGSSTLTNIRSHADVVLNRSSNAAMGGIVGDARDSTIADVEFSPKTNPFDASLSTGKMHISSGDTAPNRGGVVGYMSGTTLARAHVSVPITGTWGGTLGTYLGGLVGEARLSAGGVGSISDSSFTGSITIDNASNGVLVGGLVGRLGLPLSNSFSNGNLLIKYIGGGTGASMGGAVGTTLSGSSIHRVSSTGTFTVETDSGSWSQFYGGLVGTLASTPISQSYARVTVVRVTVGVNTQTLLGGLVGTSSGTSPISDSFAFGSVSATHSKVGGLAGSSGPITRAYSFVNVGASGQPITIGSNPSTAVADSSGVYWNAEQSGTSGTTAAGRISGSSLTLEQFSDAESVATNFPNWDFSESGVWTMGSCAPYLTWMGSSPAGLCPAVVAEAPVLTGVTAGDGQLSVAFTQGSDGGSTISNYKYSVDGTNYTALDPIDASSPVVITGLTNGTEYSVTLKAVNGQGDSLASNAMTGTPVAPAAEPDPTPAPTQNPPSSDPAPAPASEETTPPAEPTPTPTPATTPNASPAPTPTTRPAAAPTIELAPPVVSTPVAPTPPPASPAAPPAANPAPIAEAPARPGALVVGTEEILNGAIFVGTDTQELVMPAFVLMDIANRLAPDGARVEDGALVIATGQMFTSVLLVQLGEVRLAATDMGSTIQFTLNIPGFESTSMSVVLEKQTLTLAFQSVLMVTGGIVAAIFAWWFFALLRRGKNRNNPKSLRRVLSASA